MLRTLFLLLLVLAPGEIFAESVTVHWRVRFTTSTGEILSQPTAAYLQNLATCGHRPDLRKQSDLLPVSVLRCRGVLSFDSSDALRTRLENRIHLAEKRGHTRVKGLSLSTLRKKLSSIDFALSPYGVFYSALDGAGVARRIGLNVSQVKLVILNKPFWSQIVNSPDADAFLLHEALGALDFEDTDYQRSNLLYTMSKTDHVEGDGDEPENTRVAAAERGGASVVGRGGDFNAQIFKASLMLLVDKKLEVSGVDQRFVPSKAELRKVISDTPVSVIPGRFLLQSNSCDDPSADGAQSRFTCGGFLLKGVDGKPALLITEDWPTFQEQDKYKLLTKIFQNIVATLVRNKQSR